MEELCMDCKANYEFFLHWCASTTTQREEVCRPQQLVGWLAVLKNILHFVTFHESILVSLWTFQLTLIFSKIFTSEYKEFWISPLIPTHIGFILNPLLEDYCCFNFFLYILSYTFISASYLWWLGRWDCSNFQFTNHQLLGMYLFIGNVVNRNRFR